MAMQFFDQAVAQNEFIVEAISSLEKQKLVPDAVTGSDENRFDCNICMDPVQDPVVTLCGHLYCWPCIYKWLQDKSDPTENGGDQKQQQCPVCKSEVSQTTLVPLYGRGKATNSSKGNAPQLGIIIPRRPLAPAYGIDAYSPRYRVPYPHHQTYMPQSQDHAPGYAASSQMFSLGSDHPRSDSIAASPMFSLGGMTPNLFEPVIGMFVEMVFTRIYRNPITNLYTYQNTYQAGINSPRLRRHVIQADRSLCRICCFLYCCLFLCLILF